MLKDQIYHESAIKYNEGLAEFAETLAPTLENEEVRKWCTAVGKQHRFHAKRHRSALNKILMKEVAPSVEVVRDGMDVPADTEDVVVMTATSTEVEDIVKQEVLSDGCTPYHDPANVLCDFYPKGK